MSSNLPPSAAAAAAAAIITSPAITTSAAVTTSSSPSPSSASASTSTSTSSIHSSATAFIGPRQLRPLKSPLYIPAVLRPSSIICRKSSRASDLSPALLSPALLSPAMTDFEQGLLGLGKVTAPPSKDHWKSDHDSNICDDASCTRSFTYFNRRHHCRRCGNIFCDDHSTHAVPLDQNANYHPRGHTSRACAHCFTQYQLWSQQQSRRSSSESSHDDAVAASPPTPNAPLLPSTPFLDMKNPGFFPRQPSPGVVGQFGTSVPRDWVWSTF